ncbi:hypothetical protein [Methylobacterium sp. D54C]|jgi:hypothetical protein
MRYPDPVIPLLRSLANKISNKSPDEIYDTLIKVLCRDCPFPFNKSEQAQLEVIDLGGQDTPFPLGFVLEGDRSPWNFQAQLKQGEGEAAASTKRLGRATYRANQIGPTVTITASGQLPNANTGVRLEQLAFLIYPPMFGLFFYEPRLGNVEKQDFPAEITFHIGSTLQTVTIVDADGYHTVEVENF